MLHTSNSSVRWMFQRTVLFGVAVICVFVGSALATPPEYQTFQRDQVVDYQPTPSALMRIWCIYIGQGDSLLIQFPSSQSGQEMLIDGGPGGNQLAAFLKGLYPGSTAAAPTLIENAVLTHHDDDHVSGLTSLLSAAGFKIGNIFHNGLASWKVNSEIFPGSTFPGSAQAITDATATKAGKRGMAVFKDGGPDLEMKGLVADRARLVASQSGFTGIYKSLADAVTGKGVNGFDRAPIGHAGLAATAPVGIKITPLWPPQQARGYAETFTGRGDWSHTVNGNSVVFRLDYGDFSMLFTGDLNEASEEDLLGALRSAGRIEELHTDVLKVPHHGSDHGIQEFFDAVSPVMSVASMGEKGFLTNWKHPSTRVIGWLGGPHRFYSTFIEERAFDYAKLKTKVEREPLIEKKNVLIETDGIRFRIVEVEDVNKPIPGVRNVRRGDGTRWIKASEN